MQQFSACLQEAFPGVRATNRFSKQKVSCMVSEFFTTTGVEGILGGKDFSALEMVFPLISAFLDRATGYETQPVLTEINTLYSDIVNILLHSVSNMYMLILKSFPVKEKYVTFKQMRKYLFQKLHDLNLFTLKCHPLDHVVEEVNRFGRLQ